MCFCSVLFAERTPILFQVPRTNHCYKEVSGLPHRRKWVSFWQEKTSWDLLMYLGVWASLSSWKSFLSLASVSLVLHPSGNISEMAFHRQPWHVGLCASGSHIIIKELLFWVVVRERHGLDLSGCFSLHFRSSLARLFIPRNHLSSVDFNNLFIWFSFLLGKSFGRIAARLPNSS